MSKNKLKEIWNSNNYALNGWISINNPFSAEIMSRQNYDTLTIDMQHGLIDYSDLLGILQAITGSGVMPIVRVPWLDPGYIMKALDAGAEGIICPMINNKKEAEQFVSFMKYPPLGNRSFGPTRQNIISGNNYYSNANENVLCIAMIETEEAMKNLSDIISTDGLDAVYIGPADLTLGTTKGRLPPGMDREEEEMVGRIKTILSESKKAEKKACLHCVKTSYAIKAVRWGFDLVTLNSDTRLLASSALNSITEFRNGLK